VISILIALFIISTYVQKPFLKTVEKNHQL